MKLLPPIIQKKGQGMANFLFTSQENKGFSKEAKMKISPFYVGSDKIRVNHRFREC
jgi:hypothetical protein